MTANTIDGKALAAEVRAEVAQRVAVLRSRGLQPTLAVILVGDNAASMTYVRHKGSDCESVGMRFILDRYPVELTETALLERIEALNADPSVHGILVQLPLPKHIDTHKVIATISPLKDADGFHVQSAGALMIGLPGFRPCTPYGCMRMLQSAGVDPKGKHAVVIGRSNIVGKPMALLLLQAHATVTICHSATPDLGAHAPGGHPGGSRRPAQHHHSRHGQARRGGDRRRHEPERGRQAVRRRRFRRRARGGGLDHARTRRRRPDDAGDAAGQHGRGCRACRGLTPCATAPKAPIR
jgi:hypothetical protein